jgi:hypothetical protein
MRLFSGDSSLSLLSRTESYGGIGPMRIGKIRSSGAAKSESRNREEGRIEHGAAKIPV